MKRNEAFPSQYLGQKDIERPITAIIEAVRFEEVQGDHGAEDKPVLFFKNDEPKKMILNNTNWGAIEDAYGDESDNWNGKSIELYVDPGIMFGNQRKGGLRVRVPAHGGKPAKASADTWTWDEAQNQAESVGISKSGLVAKLKAAGKVGWNAARDTGFVRDLVEAALAQDAPADDPDDIPF